MPNLFIPSKIKVGFQNRSETFTGKLAYVIYYDSKGVLRKEESWKSWRDEKIEPLEIDNTPRSGYLFNKGVQRGGYHWSSGRSLIRVYDPRDFEFEISVDNLMGILMHSDISKRDIVEECVFAWQGKDLVLLPVSSEEYQSSVAYTKKLSEKVSAKSLVKGYTYNQKRSDDVLTYVGYFEWFDWALDKDLKIAPQTNKNRHYEEFETSHHSLGKKHIFFNEKTSSFNPITIETLSSVNTEEVVSNYSMIVENFFKTINSQEIVDVKNIKSDTFYNGNVYSGTVFDTSLNLFVHIHHYSYSEKTDLNDLSSYHAIRESKFSFFDKKTVQTYSESEYNYGWNQKKNPLVKKLQDSAHQMGFGTTLTKDEINQVLVKSGFGKLMFVLKNGALCESKF